MKRKWGNYFVLWKSRHFRIKLLYFKKDGECSRQYHNYRNELWLFLFGRGIFSTVHGIYPRKRGDYQWVLKQSEHKYKAKTRTLVLEIWYGKEMDENDIIRF